MRLVRFPNLIIVALTQYLLQYLVLVPPYVYYQSQLELNDLIVLKPFQFFLLVISTICIAAGGYIINDIEDVKIDKINKPEKKQIVGRQISMQQAWILYISISLIGFFISVYLANYIHHFEQLVIYPCAVFLLYSYSRWLKKRPLIGNLVVSFFCAFVAFVVLYAQTIGSDMFAHWLADPEFDYLTIFLGYSIFAFLSTLFREIIKDMEDVVGDKAVDCKTLPIVLGIKTTKFIAFLVGILLLIAVFYFSWLIDNWGWKFFLIHALISLPTLFSLYKLYLAKDKKDFTFLSQFAKLIMLSGLIFILVMQV